MKTVSLSLLLFLNGILFLHGGEEPPDPERMQGLWQVVSLAEKGKPAPADEIEPLEVSIVKDILSVSAKDKVLVRYRLKLDPTTMPKQADFLARVVDPKESKEKEPAKLMTELGIYAWEGDLLKLAIEEEGKKRPASFDAKDTATCSVMVLKKKASAVESK